MRRRRRNKHHIVPRFAGGEDTPENLLLLYEDKHSIWHRLFGLRNLDQVIALLQRVKRIKSSL